MMIYNNVSNFHTMNVLMQTFFAVTLLCSSQCVSASGRVIPFTPRVNIQDETAAADAILLKEWVGVGTKKAYSISVDSENLFQGKPSFRFELKQNDNTLAGYHAGETKGRAELSYCFARPDDLRKLTEEQKEQAALIKKVYFYGKGFCRQGSTMFYRFSIYVPSGLSPDVNTIFAQWHGMPDRTLLKTPEGVVRKVTDAEFATLCKRMIFKKDEGYDRVTGKDGRPTASSKPNGWLVEQGGYPPLAFGFAKGFFYIKANSDRKWLSDKTDRCNVDPSKSNVMEAVSSRYKSSIIAAKMPFGQFPKNCWVTFDIKVQWSVYGREQETIGKNGQLDVMMVYAGPNAKVEKKHLVNNQHLPIGRNDEMGYYFKFGIYRLGSSNVPVIYNLAGFSQHEI